MSEENPTSRLSHTRQSQIVLIASSALLIGAVGMIVYTLSAKPTTKQSEVASPATSQSNPATTGASQSVAAPATTTAAVGDLELDPAKNYGNKYASGLLPVGDGKFSITKASVGSIYLCSAGGGGGGASTRGPWFTNKNTQYDLNKKVKVQGSVKWDSVYSATVSGTNRIISGNDLPSHATGTFPISSSDPAHKYDANPNHIAAQVLSYTLPAFPAILSTPGCIGAGEIGIMTTGAVLFNGFDAGNRDAGAWEIQDDCGGHPQQSSEYHYHTLSSCIGDTSVATVIGYAFDGFPITGPKVGTGNILTTSDLDVCHGITSTITLDGRQVKTYHYVMTQDFPYSISCFRGKSAVTTKSGGMGGTPPVGSGPPPRM